MECLHPTMLKSGVLVPCGKCTICQSKIRTEKSVLVQLHCDSFDRMPLFIGLSYDEDHLPWYCTCPTEKRLDHASMGSHSRFYRKDSVHELKLSCVVPSVYRHDISSFLKSYKRINGLNSQKFTYFGCAEYGDTYDRPHYHLIWFGDDQLENLFERSVHHAERWLAEFWQMGHVDINRAEWSGIHYVTKYCMKDSYKCPDGAILPFTISSNYIGYPWLKTLQAERIRQKLMYCQFNRDEIYSRIDLSVLDWNDPQQRICKLKEYLDYLKPILPNFEVTLPSGKKAFLPRKLKRSLLGSFEHFKDNPIWLYNTLQEWYETEKYLLDFKEFDQNNEFTNSYQQRQQHAISINQRIRINQSKRK